MGDRAYVRLTCRREDSECFAQLGFVEDEAEGDIAMSMVDSEANYAHYYALIELAEKGAVFCGWHDAGCELIWKLRRASGLELRHVLRILLAGTRVRPILDQIRVFGEGKEESLGQSEGMPRFRGPRSICGHARHGPPSADECEPGAAAFCESVHQPRLSAAGS